MMRKPHWEIVKTESPKAVEYYTRLARSIAKETKKTLGKYLDVQAEFYGPLMQIGALRRITIAEAMGGIDPMSIYAMATREPMDLAELTGEKPLPGIPGQDWTNGTTVGIYSLFVGGGERIFKVAREFGQCLEKVDLKIETKHLPALPAPICIEFPESIRFHDEINGDYFHCAYVVLQHAKGEFEPIDSDGVPIHLSMAMVFPCYRDDGSSADAENLTWLNFRSAEEPIEEVIERCVRKSRHPLGQGGRRAIEYMLKVLVYLESGDPDLREYRAPRPTTDNAKKLRRWRKDHANRSLVDMTLIGFDFKKPRTYSAHETDVSGHFRWQPWGPGHSKVKLIWIDPFVRKYRHVIGGGTTDGNPEEGAPDGG